jgi:hypothetical protein
MKKRFIVILALSLNSAAGAQNAPDYLGQCINQAYSTYYMNIQPCRLLPLSERGSCESGHRAVFDRAYADCWLKFGPK